MSTTAELAFVGALVLIVLSAALGIWFARRRRAERPARTWQIAAAAIILVSAVVMPFVERH